MNTLKAQDNRIYKLAWEHNLQISGVEEGEPLFLGDGFKMNLFFEALERNNLI